MLAVGHIAGRLEKLPLIAGKTAAYSYLGITPPPPNYMLEAATMAPAKNDAAEARWLLRFGMTHAVWGSADSVVGTLLLDRRPDPVLDRLVASDPFSRHGGLGPWKLVRVPDVFPPAWIARGVHEPTDWKALFLKLSLDDARDQAWFEPGDRPSWVPDPVARTASMRSWNGKTAIVEHDGLCFLILPRAFYSRWVYQVGGGAEQPLSKSKAACKGLNSSARERAGAPSSIAQPRWRAPSQSRFPHLPRR